MASAEEQKLIFLGQFIRILVFTLLTLSYLTVGLRIWVRYRITRNPGWDDAAMIATLVSHYQPIGILSEAHGCRCFSLSTVLSLSSS
jgi:hypothetical protein